MLITDVNSLLIGRAECRSCCTVPGDWMPPSGLFVYRNLPNIIHVMLDKGSAKNCHWAMLYFDNYGTDVRFSRASRIQAESQHHQRKKSGII